jgi:hypothetical protein
MSDDILATSAKSAVGASRLLLGGVGVITTIAGLVNTSTVAALNTAGVIGVGALVIGGGVYLSGNDGVNTPEQRSAHARTTLFVMLGVSAVFGLLLLIGRPLDEDEKAAGLLTVIGCAYLFFCAFLAVSAGPLFGPEHKTCPDCANNVLAAARKCQHCGYRFG